MRLRGLLLFVFAAATVFDACRPDPLGQPCREDRECGPGFDCFENACFQVCTRDDECRAGSVCRRYRCATPRAADDARADDHARAADDVGASTTPPVPDPVVAELRAIRRELELLRHEMAHALGQPHGHDGGERPGSTVTPGATGSDATSPPPGTNKPRALIRLPPGGPGRAPQQ